MTDKSTVSAETLVKRLREFHPCGKHSNMPCDRCEAAARIEQLVGLLREGRDYKHFREYPNRYPEDYLARVDAAIDAAMQGERNE